MARAYNNVLAMLIATIGLAIPLTANMHTPKLIEMFLRDRINRWVLSFMAFGAAHVLWVDYIIGPKFAPTWAIALAVFFAIVGWALLMPYFFYVVRFVDPSRLIIRLREDAHATSSSRSPTRTRDPQHAQTEISTRVDQIGTIIIKSLDRNDRDVAAEGAWAIKVLLDHYDKHKSRMPKEWFVVDRADFVGLSDEALEMLTETRTWYEMKCLQQIEHGFLRALHGANDTVSTFSDATRVIATPRRRAPRRAGAPPVHPVLQQLPARGDQGAQPARGLRRVPPVPPARPRPRRSPRDAARDRPPLRVLRGDGADVRHGVRAAARAVRPRLRHAPRLRARVAGRAGSAARRCSSLPHRTGNDVHSMAVKAKLILGGFFVENKLEAEAELVRKNLRDVDARQIERAEAELLAADRSFFEVTDRQLNLEYVPPERREPLQAVLRLATVGRA